MDTLSQKEQKKISLRVSEKVLLFCILVLSVFFRILAASELSFSNDELSALTRARFDSFSEMIRGGVYIDFHPAGVQSFIYYWLKFAGDEQFVHRIPFVICGVLSTWLIYLIGKRCFSVFTGLFASAIFAVFQFGILYSFFARPYSPGLLFSLLAAFAWLKIFFTDKPVRAVRSWWIVFVLAMIACVHIHYFSFVFAASLGVSGLFFLRKGLRFHYIVSGILIILSLIPEWNILKIQIEKGDIGGWLAPPGLFYLPEFIIHVFNDSYLVSGIIMIPALSGLVILLFNRKWTNFHTLSFSWFLFSFLLAYLYSVFRHPVIQFSTLFFVLPFLLFLFGSSIENIFSRIKKPEFIIFLILGLGTFHTIHVKGLFSKTHYGVFREVAENVMEWEQRFGKDSLNIVLNVINPEYLNYYFRKSGHQPEVYQWKIERREDLQKFSSALDSINEPYFCYAWTNSINPYEIIRMLRAKYPVVFEKKAYYNSGVYLFSMHGISVCDEPLLQLQFDIESGSWNSAETDLKDSTAMQILDSIAEFGPGFQKRIEEVPGKGYRMVTVSAEFRSDNSITNSSVVISFDTDGTPLQYNSLNLDECNLNKGNWNKVYFSRAIPEGLAADVFLNAYIYNRDKAFFEIRNYQITIESWDDPYATDQAW